MSTVVLVVDVALGKPTKSSSQQGRIGPSVAVNGDTFGVNSEDSCHSTQPEISPWWSVNLLESYTVHSVRLIVGHSCCGKQLAGIPESIQTRKSEFFTFFLAFVFQPMDRFTLKSEWAMIEISRETPCVAVTVESLVRS